MAEADGTIRIVTKMDSASLQKQMSSLGKTIERLQALLNKAKDAAAKLREEYAAYVKSTADTIRGDSEKGIEDERKRLRSLADDYKKLAEERERLSKVADLVSANGGEPTAQLKQEIAANDEAISKVLQGRNEARANIARYQENIQNADTMARESEGAQKLAKQLEVAEAKAKGLDAELAKSKEEMAALQNRAKQTGLEKVISGIDSLGKKMKQLFVAGVAMRMLRGVFYHIAQSLLSLTGLSVVTGVFSEFIGRMRDAYASNEQLQGALARLRGALYSAFNPIYEAIVPALTTLVNWLARAISYISAFLSALSGKSLKENTQGAQKLAKAVGGVGGAAKEANKQLAQFDRLNTLSENAGGGGGGGGGGADVDFGGNLKFAGLENLIKTLKERLEPALKRVKEAWERLKTAFQNFKFDGSWARFLVEDLLILGGDVVLGGLTVLLDTLTAIVELFNALQTGDWSGFERALGNLFTDLAQMLDDIRKDILLIIIDALIPIAQAFDQAFGTDIAGKLMETRNNILELESPFDTSTQKAEQMKEAIREQGIVTADTTADITLSAQEATGAISAMGAGFTDTMFILKNLHMPSFHFDGWSDRELSLGPLGSFTISLPQISFYKQGGFPSAGSMFLAGEAGPELVGSFGGHNNSVINEAQLVQAFRQASSEQVALMQQQNSLLAAILNKSGEVTFKPSSAAGRVFQQSLNMYNRAMG